MASKRKSAATAVVGGKKEQGRVRLDLEARREIHDNAYRVGFTDGYMRCLADIEDKSTVARVAVNIVAVHAKGIDQAKYVIGVIGKHLRPKSTEALLNGAESALQRHRSKADAPPRGWERVGGDQRLAVEK